MKQRYFLISYTTDNNGGFFTTEILDFPSYEKIKNTVKKEHGTNCGNVTVLNIFEFKNKKDYTYFHKI